MTSQVLQNVVSSNGDTFLANMESIYANEKTAITECLEKIPPQSLKSLRDELFSKVQETLNLYAGREMRARHKHQLLASDVYTLGLCLMNNQDERGMKTVLRPLTPGITDDTPLDASQSSPTLLNICTSLREELDLMREEISELQERVASTEADNTSLKIEIGSLRRQIQVNHSGQETASHSEDDGDHEENSQDVQGPSSNDNRVDSRPQLSYADRAAGNPLGNQSNEEQTPPTNTDRQIITGSSNEELSIHPASFDSPPDAGQHYEAFVGKLHKDTTTAQLESHLLNKVGVTRDDIISIKRVRAYKYASFKVTLTNSTIGEKLLHGSLWPQATVIGPFEKRNSGRRRRNHSQHPANSEESNGSYTNRPLQPSTNYSENEHRTRQDYRSHVERMRETRPQDNSYRRHDTRRHEGDHNRNHQGNYRLQDDRHHYRDDLQSMTTHSRTSRDYHRSPRRFNGRNERQRNSYYSYDD